ncbi:hypothetical protein ACJA88_000071 [Fusarium oxysporum]
MAELQQEVETLYDTEKKVKTLIEGPQDAKLKASQDFALKITETLSVLSKVDAKLQPPAKSSVRQRLGLKSLKWPFESDQVHRVVQRIRRCSESLWLALQVDEITLLFKADIKLGQTGSKIEATHSKLDKTHHKLDEIYSKLNKPDDSLPNGVTKIPKVDDSLDIAALPLAVGAAYSSFAEQDNSIRIQSTRSEILQEINYWLDGDNSETVFWLQGMAGTGKSTVARTVATRWDKRNHLGASLFFKRGDGDRGNLSYFYKTVASQMAISIPSVSPTDRRVIAIVIDALDECDGEANVKRLLNILTRTKVASNVKIRVFITSRPELHIRLGFRSVSGNYEDLNLHEIPEDAIRRDIEAFYIENLNTIREEYNLSINDDRRLADTWPGDENIKALVKKAVPLFIFAATVCRFISQRRSASPDTQLQKALAFETKSHESKMNATYLLSLEQQLEGLSLREQDEVIEDFHRVVGPIIILETPFTIPALAKIIGITEDMIHNRLDMLHSVLNHPKTVDTPITLLHLSFRDFLLDPEKKGVNRC